MKAVIKNSKNLKCEMESNLRIPLPQVGTIHGDSNEGR